MATSVLGLKTFAASDPVDYNEVNDNYVKIDNGVKTAMQGRAAHQLLDNSNFMINQRGKSSYAASGYTVDRWKIGYGTIEVHSSYLSIIATESNSCVLKQIVADLPDGTYTFAASVNGVIKTRVMTISGGTATTIDSSNAGYTGGYLTLERDTGVGKYFVTIRANAGYTVTTEWAALYEGSYTADTLPAYVPKGYSAELAECQRYFIRIGKNGYYPMAYGISRDTTSTNARLSIHIGTTMRVNPTVSIGGSTSNIRCSVGTMYAIVSKIEASAKENKLDLWVTMEGSIGAAGAVVMISASSNEYIDFSADL